MDFPLFKRGHGFESAATGIDTVRHLLEVSLRKPYRTVFRDLRLRIRCLEFGVVHFETCSMSIFYTQRPTVLQLTLIHGRIQPITLEIWKF